MSSQEEMEVSAETNNNCDNDVQKSGKFARTMKDLRLPTTESGEGRV